LGRRDGWLFSFHPLLRKLITTFQQSMGRRRYASTVWGGKEPSALTYVIVSAWGREAVRRYLNLVP
jgi:hypothetical protein